MPDRANHAVRDGDLRIVYIAGDKGLYKLFPDSKEIHMMLAVAEGEIGYMVGYAALTRRTLPVPVNVELVFLPSVPSGYSASDARNVIKHYKPATGVVNVTPPQAGTKWTLLDISSYNPDKWLVGHTTAGSVALPALWLTENAGVTWTPVAMPMPTASTFSLYMAGFSRHADNFVWVAGSPAANAVNTAKAIWYGDPRSPSSLTRYDVHTNSRTADWYYAGIMDNGNFIVQHRYGGFTKIHERLALGPAGNVIYKTAMTANGMTGGAGVHNVANSSVVLIANNSPFPDGDHTLWYTENYLVTPVASTGIDVNTTQIAGTVDNHVYLGGSAAGIREVLTPLTAPNVVAPLAVQGFPTQGITADDQTRTVVAAMSIRSPGQLYVMVKAGEADWEELSLTEVIPEGAWINPNTFGVIVRGGP